jgi:hypothetical protein
MYRDYKSRLTALTKKLTESWSGFVILTHELWIFNPTFKNTMYRYYKSRLSKAKIIEPMRRVQYLYQLRCLKQSG